MRNMGEICKTENCAHYVSKENLHLYRNKFLIFVVSVTLCIGGLFYVLACFYNSSLNEIVEIHKKHETQLQEMLTPLKIGKDSCLYVNEQLANYMRESMESTQTLLQLQSTKIQSDFTLLSVWAGILMIVFLIFSIYSIFKTDELMKQGRDGLKAIEETKYKAEGYISQIDEKARVKVEQVSKASEEQLAKITQEATMSLDQFKQQVEKERNTFSSTVEGKTNEFQKVYEDYVKKLAESTTTMSSLMRELIDATIKQHVEEQENDKNAQETKEK